MRLIILAAVWVFQLAGQQPQNPSPMVEHSREHRRLPEHSVPGRRVALETGTLFVPENSHPSALLFFFHGGKWLPEVAAAGQNELAVITIQGGAGSSTYAKLFADPLRFPQLITEAESKSGLHFKDVELAGWSAGCGAIRQILQDPGSYERAGRVLCIDGIHTDYANGKPGPQEPDLDTAKLAVWLRLAQDAIDGRKRLIITHSEIFPGTFASTTETADYLATQLHLQPRPILEWGPMQTQMLSEIRRGNLLIVGFAGNSAPDHVDELHSLPEYLQWLNAGPHMTR